MKKNEKKFQFTKITLMLFSLCAFIAPAYSWGPTEWPNAIKMADYILSLQNKDGAIEDEQGGGIVNEDSNMEYALIGLGAAYDSTKDIKYLIGLEKGIAWLAAREEMTDPFWKGSWYYVYDYNPPYNAIPTSPGDSLLSDVRGVDATSTLFTYLLYLHYKITGSKSLVNLYETNAKAALDFVVNHNLDTDGYSWSSWQKWISDGQWHLWKYKYTADQGDVWLGLKAGALLYDTDKYGPYANFIEMNAPKDFYCTSKGRFCKGIDDFGVKDWALDGFDGIFPNGYLPWMWCSGVETEGAYNWLKSYVQTDGSIKIDSGPKYALSVSVYGMASANLKHTQPTSSFQWLNRTPSAGPFDNISGGVHDLPTSGSSLYSNVTGFSLISLMGWVPGFSCSINSLPNDAVEEQKKHLLYPNPFSTETTLQTNVNLKDATLTVYNSVVQQVKQIKNISGQAITFHRDNLPSGLYIVRLTEENNIIAEDKLVITDK